MSLKINDNGCQIHLWLKYLDECTNINTLERRGETKSVREFYFSVDSRHSFGAM